MKNPILFLLVVFLCCSAELIHSQQNSFCYWDCKSPVVDGCYTCDINELDGIFIPSSFYPYPGPHFVFDPSNPIPCPQTTPNNPIYHFFVAGSTYINCGVDVSNCIGAGVHMGLSTGCGNQCLASSVECTTSDVEIEYDDLIPGNTYMVYIDGCAGGVCDLDFWVAVTTEFELNDPYAITAFNECTDKCLTNNCEGDVNCENVDEIIVCPGEEIFFNIRHQGNSVSFDGDYDAPCSFYPAGLDANFDWFFNGQKLENKVSHRIVIPNVNSETVTEICLNKISVDCDETSEEACLTVIIRPIQPEQFIYTVCAEDINEEWVVPANDDPNGDGVFWLGPEAFSLAEVNSWNDGCFNSTVFLDPGCECEVNQTICFDVLGSIEKPNHTLYMYDCQFGENGNFE